MSEDKRSPDTAPAEAPAKKRISGKKLALVIVAVVLAVLLVAGIAVYAMYRGIANELDGENTQDGTLSDEVKTGDVYPEYTGEGIVHLLVCGLDYPEEGELPEGVDLDADKPDANSEVGGGAKTIGNTDMILYVVFDTVNTKVNIMQLPRDVFVGPDLETGGTGKINGLYINAPDADNRMDALAKCLRHQLGLPVDYYITIDMDAVKELIDQPPGYLSVYVPMEVNDPQDPKAVIPEGWRDFTSEEAEWFLRNRHSTTYKQQGDIARLQMQQSFYSALFREFKRLQPSDLLMWMRVLLYRVNTDIAPVQVGGLAQSALNIEGKDITFIRPPVSGADYNGHSLICLVPDETADLLNQYFRPEGETKEVDELDIHTLPVNHIGVSEASIRSMADVQAAEEEIDLDETVAAQQAKGELGVE